jgi:16S rRNA G966 N2-methylase RsmD
MRYSLSQFEALQTVISDQGGMLHDDLCMKQDVVFTAPPYNKDHREREVTCGCGHQSLFVLPYDSEDDKAHFVRACAVCDGIGAWPRIAKELEDA